MLTPLIEAKLKQKDTAHWVALFNSCGIPAGAILGLEEALCQEQVVCRQVLQSVYAGGIGDLKLFNLTAKFEKTPARIDSPPPRLSEHTDSILTGLGYSQEEIKALRDSGAI